jgi:hypothetical protein
MRISTNTIYQLSTSQMTALQEKISQTSQQASTGKKVMTPQDDPVGSAKLLEAKQREHKEWEHEQNEANAHDVQCGSKKLSRLERRLKKLDRQLSLTEAEHDVLREKKYAREDTIRKLTEQLGD